jgi:hypothetical protein
MTSPDQAAVPGTPAETISTEQLRAVIEQATLAPSIHNSQPWRFAAADGCIDVYADRSRNLPVVDPNGRQLLISCGGAVFYARLAIRAAGYAVATELMPTPTDRDHLARLTVGSATPTTADEQALVDAIPHRHTNRSPFADRAVPTALIADLAARASAEGAWLRLIEQSSDQMATVVLLSHADEAQRMDPAYRAELDSWLRFDANSTDGVPATAVPHVEPGAERRSAFTLRDFDLHGEGALPIHGQQVERPVVVLLGTDGDGPADWLRAGQALAHVLLRATSDGVSASPLNQVIDIPALRAQLRAQLHLMGFPQMLLRMGYGPEAEVTPRRPVEDVTAPR